MNSLKSEKIMIGAHVLVNGDVQGVFFRSKIRSQANERHVTGWVRNLRDGRVEATFEGKEEDVKALVEFCRTGPTAARVDSVEVTWHSYSGDYATFKIEY